MRFLILTALSLVFTFYIVHFTLNISLVSVTGKFGTDSTGKCITSNQTSFAPFKIPSYDDLKSIYYTQSKATKTDATPGSGTANQGTLRSALNSYDVILIQGDLNINSNLGGTPKTGVVFVEGNLTFSTPTFIFGDNNSGLVFIVQGDINIDQSTTQIDAVIISSGIIRTAGSTCTTSNVGANPLTINGSLVSLDSAKPPVFCRTLTPADNSTSPAEIIIHQPKYLVILRDLFSNTLQKWSEIQ